jgi:hypothetical protein
MDILEEKRERGEEAFGLRSIAEKQTADELVEGQVKQQGDEIGGRKRRLGAILMGDDVDLAALDRKEGAPLGLERGAEIIDAAHVSGGGAGFQQGRTGRVGSERRGSLPVENTPTSPKMPAIPHYLPYAGILCNRQVACGG